MRSMPTGVRATPPEPPAEPPRADAERYPARQDGAYVVVELDP
jgi:hypothetical protein